MGEYISKAELYKQIAEREEIARKRMLDTSASLPYPLTVNPAYTRYMAQLAERAAFKHMVADFEPADVALVVHAHWIRHENADIICGYYVPSFECSQCGAWKEDDSDFCPDCGARMDGNGEE